MEKSSASAPLTGLLCGSVLVILAAYFGELRATSMLLWLVLWVSLLVSLWPPTRRWLVGITAGLVLIVALGLLTPILRHPLQRLVISEAPVKADAIVVLGGAVKCSTMSPAASSTSRLLKGLELWRAGYAPLLTVSETSGELDPPHCPSLDRALKQLVSRLYGQQAPTLLTLSKVETTRDEAERVSELFQARKWQRVLLVTSPSHTRRAKALFEAAGVTVTTIAAQETRYDPTLELPSDRLAALQVLLYEGLSRLKAKLGRPL